MFFMASHINDPAGETEIRRQVCGSKCFTMSISVLASVAALFLCVWTVEKVIEIRQFKTYPPSGVIQHTITLTALGKTTVSPDVAEIELSVVTEGASPQNIQQSNTQKMNDIINYLKTSKIDPKDMKTSAYSLYPKYQYDKWESTISGYSVTQTLRVKVRDISALGNIVEGASVRGANQVGSIKFSVDDPDKFKNEARADAFKNLREKASDITAISGAKIGKMISYSESEEGGVANPIYDGMKAAPAAPVVPDIQQGSEDVSLTVSAVFELK